jgi:hypothetical protein
MTSVTLPWDSWRAIHGALLELALMWDSGVRPAGLGPLPDSALPDLLQKILPVLSHASAWPDGSAFEAEVRAAVGLAVPEDMLEASRALVQRS